MSVLLFSNSLPYSALLTGAPWPWPPIRRNRVSRILCAVFAVLGLVLEVEKFGPNAGRAKIHTAKAKLDLNTQVLFLVYQTFWGTSLHFSRMRSHRLAFLTRPGQATTAAHRAGAGVVPRGFGVLNRSVVGGTSRRSVMYDTSSSSDPAKSMPDYYKILGVAREASDDEIKKAFRELAKKHHPDVLAAKIASNVKNASMSETDVTGKPLQPSPESLAAAHLDFFKLLNEAYSVLSDPLLKKNYDSEKFSRTALLKMRNEGFRGGAGEAGGVVQFRRSATGLTAEELARMTPDEIFQKGMARAHEKAKDSARFRATMARANRSKIEVHDQETSLIRAIMPYVAVGSLWAGAWFLW